MEYREKANVTKAEAAAIREFLSTADDSKGRFNICHKFSDGWEIRICFERFAKCPEMYAEIYGGWDEGYEEMGTLTPGPTMFDENDAFDLAAIWEFEMKDNTYILEVHVEGEAAPTVIYSE